MDAVAQLCAEHAVDETVLSDPVETREGGCRDDRVEMMAITADIRAGARNAGLDPLLQLLRGYGHASSVARFHRYTE